MYYIIIIITIITIIISVIITFIITIIIITIIIITITIITIIITRLDWREAGFCTTLLLLLVVVVVVVAAEEVVVVVVWRMEDTIQLREAAVCTDLLKTRVFLEWHDDLVCVVSFQPQGSHVDLVVRGDGLQGKPLLHALPRPQVKGHVSWSQTETLYLFIYLMRNSTYIY